MSIVIIICVFIIGTFLFYASYSIRSNIYIRTHSKKKTEEKIVALTFDDGPHPVHTIEVLDILKKYEIPATFFCIGEKVKQHPDIIKRMSEESHLIGNHSWKHSNWFPLLSKKKMKREIEDTGKILEEITGTPIYLFRPPFGVTNPAIATVINKTHYKTIGWSIRSLDTGKEPVKKIFSRIISQLSPGDVILLHDRMPQSAELLILLLEYLKEEQFKAVRIDELFQL